MTNDYEMLVDGLVAVLEVLYEGQYPPNDETMETIRQMCDRYGYKPPKGLI